MSAQEATNPTSNNEHPLRTRRIDLRLSQAELERRCGLNTGVLNALETGRARYPNSATLAAIARGLDVPMQTLFDEFEMWNIKRRMVS